MATRHELEAAYIQGQDQGFDPEVAEDIGIPSNPESFERHLASARHIRILLADSGIEHEALNEKYGRVVCANCNRPGCAGCGKS